MCLSNGEGTGSRLRMDRIGNCQRGSIQILSDGPALTLHCVCGICCGFCRLRNETDDTDRLMVTEDTRMIGWRTYVVSAVTAAFGALAVADWNKFVEDPKAGWAIIGMSVVMAVMRSVTSTPPGAK